MALVYQHRRLDNNEIFYVGISNNYIRPYYKHFRSDFWNNIVNKVGYEVEILIDGISYDEVKELEIGLISYYGRRDLGKGHLVNLTDGGDGCVGKIMSEEHKRKISESGKGRVWSEESKKRLRDSLKNRVPSEDQLNNIRKAAALNGHNTIVDGIEYESVSSASRQTGIPVSTICNRLKKSKDGTNISINKLPAVWERVVIDGVEYSNLREASRQTGISYMLIYKRFRNNKNGK